MITLCAVAPTVKSLRLHLYVTLDLCNGLMDFIAVDMLPNNTFNNRNFTSFVLPKQTYVRFALWFQV